MEANIYNHTNKQTNKQTNKKKQEKNPPVKGRVRIDELPNN
jgi:hypothetical protein